MSSRRIALWAVAVLYAAGLAWVLIWPNGLVVRQINLEIYLYFFKRGVSWLTPEIVANVANALLFIPAVAGLALAFPRPRPLVWALAGIAVSVAVEAMQSLLPGRQASLIDVLANGSGALAGALLAAAVRAYFSSRRRSATRTSRNSSTSERMSPGSNS